MRTSRKVFSIFSFKLHVINKSLRRPVLSLLILAALSCTYKQTKTFHITQKLTRLTIVLTGDTHGHYLKSNLKGNPGVGGFAAMNTLLTEIRSEVTSSKGEVLFLHSGDFNTGTPESDLLQSKPDILALNKMKLDTITIGNHELDKPVAILMKQMEWASFPFLSANVRTKKDNALIGRPFILRKIQGTKIYILGLTTFELKSLIMPSVFKDIRVENPVKTARHYIKKFDPDSLIIVLSHLGINGEMNSYYAGEFDDKRLARDAPGIDLILGGHSHIILRNPVIIGKTLILHSGAYAMGVVRIDLIIENGEIIDYRHRYIPINEKIEETVGGRKKYIFIEREIPEDREILKLTAPYVEKLKYMLLKVIGSNKTYLSREGAGNREIALGNLLTDAMLKKGDCQVAIQGSGGIRADLPDGPVMIRHVYSIHPFGNTIVRTTLTGEQLKNVLEEGFRRGNPSNFLQISGMEVRVLQGSVEIKTVQGSPFDTKKTYVLCSDNFLASGGDNMKKLANIPSKYDTGTPVTDGLIDFIRNLQVLDYKKQNRISLK